MLTITPYIPATMLPVTKELSSIKVAGRTIGEEIRSRLCAECDSRELTVRADFVPSLAMAAKLADCQVNTRVVDSSDGEVLAEVTVQGAKTTETIAPDADSLRLRYPWDLLKLMEQLVGALTEDVIEGTIRERVTIDGHIRLGKGSVILPGVYIEGNAVFGENCKIGPNCYIRGNTSTGDKCHIGQSCEVKNSLFFDHVSAGHLSYIGDSVVCDKVNFGAGTITSNFRHDNGSHKFRVNGELISTGRRKFGAIIGENVHTGIHTAIYPGRSLPADATTNPGDVIRK